MDQHPLSKVSRPLLLFRCPPLPRELCPRTYTGGSSGGDGGEFFTHADVVSPPAMMGTFPCAPAPFSGPHLRFDASKGDTDPDFVSCEWCYVFSFRVVFELCSRRRRYCVVFLVVVVLLLPPPPSSSAAAAVAAVAAAMAAAAAPASCVPSSSVVGPDRRRSRRSRGAEPRALRLTSVRGSGGLASGGGASRDSRGEGGGGNEDAAAGSDLSSGYDSEYSGLDDVSETARQNADPVDRGWQLIRLRRVDTS